MIFLVTYYVWYKNSPLGCLGVEKVKSDCCNYKKYCSSTLFFLFFCLLHVVAAGHSRRERRL